MHFVRVPYGLPQGSQGFQWISKGFPIDFPKGFRRVPAIVPLRISYGFPKGFPRIPMNFIRISYGFPKGFLRVPMDFLMMSYVFPKADSYKCPKDFLCIS